MNEQEIVNKKRGRKTKIVKNKSLVEVATEVAIANTEVDIDNTEVAIANTEVDTEVAIANTEVATEEDETKNNENKLPKKRGRKPKGGKIILNSCLNETSPILEPNIILHLKCRQSDLIQNNFLSDLNNCVETFQFEQNKKYELNYQVINDSVKDINPIYSYNVQIQDSVKNIDDNKIILDKLKELTYNLHTNNISDKKSACFWCTCDFDNPCIFIPKFELNNMYYCYGCFCSPECATAFLFKESIDTSTRFERYHLLNHIYCKIYDYKKNIKPAPDPYYTLNKYYGNLSIQEYRKLLKNERLLLIVDKPLSRTLPELHEDNDEFIYNGKNIPSSNKFKLRRKNKQSKTDILSDTFNLKPLF